MPSIERVCKITGKNFFVSELEQKLREGFGVGLPDVHPYERARKLMIFRNLTVLYNDKCDLCGNHTLSVWGENPKFPVWCTACWNAEKWQQPQAEVNLGRSFFDQMKELYDQCGRPARIIQEPFVNSDYCNSGTALKNCYMCFNSQFLEDCQYAFGSRLIKNCLDVIFIRDTAEFLYECLACPQSFQVFWSEFAIKCTDSYFLYDCSDCQNCALSTGLRHKSYVFLNEQLSPEEYNKKVADLKSGSYETIQKSWRQFQELKKVYPKKNIIGIGNENVSGNIIFNSKNVLGSYDVNAVEDSVNLFTINNAKDSLDFAAFGGLGAEKIYSCAQVGNKATNIQLSYTCYDSCFNLTYCIGLNSSHDCFGAVFGRKLEYSILNKKYSPEQYSELVARIKEKMVSGGEYGEMFRADLIPFAYNETQAQMVFPLKKEEAEKLGYRWVDRKFPSVPPLMKLTPPDNIKDIEWPSVDGKALICIQSGRPFKITKTEFEFYKKYSIPLPRIHPEERLFNRYPRQMLYNLHSARCGVCQAELETSHPLEEVVLCDKCYQEKVV